MSETSTKPYLIRAIYEWCNDNGYTPYLAVSVDSKTVVPREFVKNGEIVLNISPLATNGLQMGNEWIGFQARFGGRARELSVPVDNVSAIYAKETGHGMAFDIPKPLGLAPGSEGAEPFEGVDAPDAGLQADAGAPAVEKGLRSVLNVARSDPTDGSQTDSGKKASLEDPEKPSPDSPPSKPRLTRIK